MKSGIGCRSRCRNLNLALTQPAPGPKLVGGEANVFGRLSRLPVLRPSTLKLLAVSLESDSALFEFETAFKSDPVLAADLLIVANSPLFGMRGTVQGIRHAIAMLGLERVRSLALTIAMRTYMRSGRWNQLIRGPWRHSIATAVIAETLEAAEQTHVPLLYTAGLMHDVGRLALLQISPDKYSQVLSGQFSSIQEYLHMETFLFDCAHDDAGAFLAMAWGLPISLCDCIRFHHWDVAAHAGRLFELVAIACRLADILGYPEVQRTNIEEGPDAVTSLLPPRLRNSPALAPLALRAKIEAQLVNFPATNPLLRN
jgi:HD-like signal output (HDOD) protein